jgi:hypothetical protein
MLILPKSAGEPTMIAGCVEANSTPTEAAQATPPWLIRTSSVGDTDVADGN